MRVRINVGTVTLEIDGRTGTVSRLVDYYNAKDGLVLQGMTPADMLRLATALEAAAREQQLWSGEVT